MNRLPWCRRQLVRAGLLGAMLPGSVFAQETPELLGPSPGGIYEATLPNGLRILMKEVHAAPIMCVSIWYRAGSKHEEAGRTGLAHLLEHMMFKGTARHGKGVYDRILEGNGALNNASTWLDRTNYYVAIAADRVDIAMELEADRMRGALFTDADLSDEMPVVRNELEIGEDDPFTELDERISSVAFLEHPYHWPTIGWKSDVEAIGAADIHAYYDKYYWPNNAYLVLVGDLTVQEMLQKAVRHFGALPSGGVAPEVVTVEPPQKGERRFLIRETGESRHLGFGYRIPVATDPDMPALDMLGRILASGRSSRLYRALVETGLASEVEAYVQPMEDPFLFFIYVTLTEDADPDEVARVLDVELVRLGAEPPSSAEVARAFKQYKVSTFFSRDDLVGLMSEIGEAESQGGYALFDRALASMEAISPADVQRAAIRYLADDQRTVGFYLPKGKLGGSWTQGSGASGGGGTEHRNGPRRTGLQRRGSSPVPGTPRSLDQSAPAAGVGAAQKPVSKQVLDNGAVLLVQESHDNPTVALRARLRGGLRLELPNRAGVAALTAAAWPLGTSKRSAAELSELLESHGIALDLAAERDAIVVEARCLSEDLPLLVEILGEVLREPLFDPEQIEIARDAVRQELRERQQSTYSMAYHRALTTIYGEGSPYARLIEGDEAILQSLGRAELIEYHRSLLYAGGWSFAIVGDVSSLAVRKLLADEIGTVPGGEPELEPAPGLPTPFPEWALVSISVPDKSQADLVFVGPGVTPGTQGYEAAYLANTTLGEAYTSRLNGTLRDDEGLTYGAYSEFEGFDGGGLWIATLGVNPENVPRALAAVRGVLRSYVADGVTEEEMTRSREYAAGSYALRIRSKNDFAAELLRAEQFGLGPDAVSGFGDRLRAVSNEEIQAAARRLVDPGHLIAIVAGTLDE